MVVYSKRELFKEQLTARTSKWYSNCIVDERAF
jgi:hypothetical protein